MRDKTLHKPKPYLTHVSSNLSIKAIDGVGSFVGYASVFGVVDHHNEVIERGAFKASLKAWAAKGQLPKMLWQHETSTPIGIWEEMNEDEWGLRVKGRLLLDVQKAREAYTFLKAGAIDGMSIGFRPVESYRAQKQGVKVFTKLDLFEVSLVTFGANPEAHITDVKHRIVGNDETGFIHKIQGAINEVRMYL